MGTARLGWQASMFKPKPGAYIKWAKYLGLHVSLHPAQSTSLYAKRCRSEPVGKNNPWLGVPYVNCVDVINWLTLSARRKISIGSWLSKQDYQLTSNKSLDLGDHIIFSIVDFNLKRSLHDIGIVEASVVMRLLVYLCWFRLSEILHVKWGMEKLFRSMNTCCHCL